MRCIQFLFTLLTPIGILGVLTVAAVMARVL